MTIPESLPEHLAAIWPELENYLSKDCPPAIREAVAGQIHRQRQARTRIDREGEIVADPKGNPIPHPALAIETGAQKQIAELIKPYRR